MTSRIYMPVLFSLWLVAFACCGLLQSGISHTGRLAGNTAPPLAADTEPDDRPVVYLYTAGPPWPSWCGPCNRLNDQIEATGQDNLPFRIEPRPAEDAPASNKYPAGTVPCWEWTGQRRFVYHTADLDHFIKVWTHNN